MKKLALLVFLLLAGVTWAPPASLYDQSIAEILRKRFTSPSLSYLLMDEATGTIAAALG